MFSFKSSNLINFIPKRFIRKPHYLKSWPNDWVPFHWSRPETIPGYKITGDLETIRQPSEVEMHPKYKNSAKLTDLGEQDPIKKTFSLDHASKRERIRSYQSELYKERGLIHELDFSNSLEAKIINLTIKLRGCLAEIEYIGPKERRGSQLRTIANSMRNRRHRYLCELKEIHSDRHKGICEKLNIEHIDNPINVPYYEPFRKVQMRRLALEYAANLKEKKVEEYIRSLETEKEKFEAEKEETLRWIAEQEKILSG